MQTTPSASARMTSSGNTATPPQATGSCQPTKVSPATEAGAAVPWHHTGNPVPSTPAMSRTTPSDTSAATPRLAMREVRMSPKIPASVTPMASTTAMQPSGISSMAARVERGDDHDSGVARSSRAGTKRIVNARPTMRLPCAVTSGLAPRIHRRRRPFFRSTVVTVAVEISAKAARVAASRVIGRTRWGWDTGRKDTGARGAAPGGERRGQSGRSRAPRPVAARPAG